MICKMMYANDCVVTATQTRECVSRTCLTSCRSTDRSGAVILSESGLLMELSKWSLRNNLWSVFGSFSVWSLNVCATEEAPAVTSVRAACGLIIAVT